MLESLKYAPYYNDYSNEKEKQYTQLLAVPGRVAQARELTQIQSTMKDIIKSIGDNLFSDGDVLEGCDPIPPKDGVVDSSTGKLKYTITPGKVYINGMILPVKESTVWVSPTGSETIGLKLVEKIVDYDTDPTLTDPASGHANYKMPGCARLKSEVVITTLSEDPSAKELVKLIDGAVALENSAPEYDAITKKLAARTYDESGSYVVDGFGVRLEENRENKEKFFDVVVDSGKAYVRGYELKVPAARRIRVDRSILTIEGEDENPEYDGSNITVLRDDGRPILESIVSVEGTVLSEGNSVSGNNSIVNLVPPSGGSNVVTSTENANTAIKVYKSDGTIYVRDRDYKVNTPTGSNPSIEWLPTATIRPGSGDSYLIDFCYKRIFEQGNHYQFKTDEDGRQYIEWSIGGYLPVENTILEVRFNVYTARKDLLYINDKGDILVEMGIPDIEGREIAPNVPLDALPLAYISNPPGGEVNSSSSLNIGISTVGLTRFTMEDIHDIVKRIKTIEYDQANLSLNEEAMNYNTSAEMRGIFTDSLIDFSRVSFDYRNPSWNAMIDTANRVCHLPVLSDYFDLVYDIGRSTTDKTGNIITLSKRGDSVVVREQLKATHTFTVNPYSQAPQLPEITLSPSVDSFIDIQHLEAKIDLQEEQKYKDLPTKWVNTYNWNLKNKLISTDYGNTSRVEVSRTDSGDKLFLEVPQAYMRQRVVTVRGSYFSPESSELVCTIDGVKVDLKVGSRGSQHPSNTSAINPDSNGNFEATFTVPEKIPTGAREVKIEALNKAEGFNDTASALYYGTHSIQYYQRTITVVTHIITERIQTMYNYLDPIGQTFVLDNTTILDGVGLYFAKFPEGTNVDSLAPITCEIREVSNGTITSESSIAHKTLKASDIQVVEGDNPDYAEKETVFKFESPVLLIANKEYAFVIRSTSPSYSLWVAELGSNDITSERDGVAKPVLYNPYLQGNMMSSSNNSSWTVHQTTDLKFRLLASEYEQENQIIFDKITDVKGFSGIYLKSAEDIPEHTSVRWEYSLDGNNYSPIAKDSLELLNTVNSDITIRATLRRDASNTTLSPMIVADSVGLELSRYEIVSSYAWTNGENTLYTEFENPNTGVTAYRDANRTESLGEITSRAENTLTVGGTIYTKDSTKDAGAGWYVSHRINDLDPYDTVDIILDTYSVGKNDNNIEVWVNVDNTEFEQSNLIKAELTEPGRSTADGWTVSSTYRVNLGEGTSERCRILIKLSSKNAQYTPAFRKLRAIMSKRIGN